MHAANPYPLRVKGTLALVLACPLHVVVSAFSASLLMLSLLLGCMLRGAKDAKVSLVEKEGGDSRPAVQMAGY